MSIVPAIGVEQLGKAYRITHGGSGYRTLRESLIDLAKLPARFRKNAETSKGETFWALKDVNLSIMPGEAVGIIGRNGSGKSTLLKLLSRVTKPTSGRITLNGRVGSLLEVGTGFHPELTGRENIYLNGAMLGMTSHEIRSKFDEIVEFAEVSQFLDTPVKRYSSGMYVRLAFAVAAHLEPEILLVDEVLAVGDSKFQRKCLGKMGQVARQGRTILFISHNMGAITRLCDRVLWLDQGSLRDSGPAEQIVSKYLASDVSETSERIFDLNSPEAASEYVRPLAIRVTNAQGQLVSAIDIRQPFNLEVHYEILRPAPDLRIGLTLLTHDGTVILNTLDTDNPTLRDRSVGRYLNRCTIPGSFLNCGQYFVSVGADFPMVRSHFLAQQAVSFQIEQTGGIGGHVADGRSGVIRMDLPWAVEKLELVHELGLTR